MGFLDKVTAFVKREAKDIGEVADDVKDKLDAELTRRETELEMTPSEKIEALQQQASDTDAKLDAIANKALGEPVAEPDGTRIVLPDADATTTDEVVEQLDDGTEADEVLDRLDPPVADSHVVAEEADHLGAAEAGGVQVDDLSSLPAPPASPADAENAEIDATQDVGETEDESDPADHHAEAQVDSAEVDDATLADDAAVDADASPTTDDAAEPAESADAPDADEAGGGDGSADADVAEADDEPASDEVGAIEATESADDDASDADKAAAEASAAVAAADFGKTPAQLKYERARDAANQLLEELRGELQADGEI